MYIYIYISRDLDLYLFVYICLFIHLLNYVCIRMVLNNVFIIVYPIIMQYILYIYVHTRKSICYVYRLVYMHLKKKTCSQDLLDQVLATYMSKTGAN